MKKVPLYTNWKEPSLTMEINMHESVTVDRVLQAVERRAATLDNPGICILCGTDAEGVEPDARQYRCEHCGGHGVYGVEELMFMMVA